MVKHVVMWRLKDQADGPAIREKLEGMIGKVPSLAALETGENFASGEAAFDLVLITEHADRTALETYGNDPDHVKVKEFIAPRVAERVVVDFEA